MYTVVIIPMLVSHNITDRLVPLLAKLIERNIAITHTQDLKEALEYKLSTKPQSDIWKWLKALGSDIVTSSEENNKKISYKTPTSFMDGENDVNYIYMNDINDSSSLLEGVNKLLGKEIDLLREADDKPDFADIKDKIEIPKNVNFYANITLEPTVVNVPVKITYIEKDAQDQFDAKSGKRVPLSEPKDIKYIVDETIPIGFKCMPYKLEGTESSLYDLLHFALSQNKISGWFYRSIEKTKRFITRKIIFSKNWWDALSVRGLRRPNYEDVSLLYFSPQISGLSPKKLAKILDQKKHKPWTAATVFSSLDFDTEKSREIVDKGMYRTMVKNSFGDILIVDESKEILYMCMEKTLSCTYIGFDTLKSIVQADGVLEYADVSRKTSPFRRGGRKIDLAKVLENCSYNTKDQLSNINYKIISENIRNKELKDD